MFSRIMFSSLSLMLLGGGLFATSPTPDNTDEAFLRKHGLPTDPAGLIGFVLERSGKTAKDESIQQLVLQIGNDKFERREEAKRELKKLGHLAAQELRRQLKHTDLELRRRAQAYLTQIERETAPDRTCGHMNQVGPIYQRPISSIAEFACSLLMAQAADAKKDPPGQRCVRVIEAYKKRASAIQFSPNGKELLSSGDEALRIWNPRTGKLLRETGIDGDSISKATYVADGKRIACTAGTHRRVHLLDTRTLQRLHSIDSEDRSIYCLVSAMRGDLAAFGVEGEIRLFNAMTGKVTKPIHLGKLNTPWTLAFSPDANTLAAGIEYSDTKKSDQWVALYDVATGKEKRRVPLPVRKWWSMRPRPICFGPRGCPFVIGMNSTSVIPLWDLEKNKLLGEIDWIVQYDREKNPRADDDSLVPRAGLRDLCFSADGKTLATSCLDGKVRLWEVETARLRQQIEVKSDRVALSSKATQLATASFEEGRIRLWDWRYAGERLPRPTVETLEKLWADCGAEDSASAFRAVNVLVALPKESVELLEKRLKRIEPVSKEQLKEWIGQLDSDKRETRVIAFQKLSALGRAAEAILRDVKGESASAELKRSLRRLLTRIDVLTPEELRVFRAIEVLEAIATPEAHHLLIRLAGGANGAVLTDHAKASLLRIAEAKAREIR